MRKRLLVDVDANQWAALKGQAAAEGRFVRVLLAEALGAYLATARGNHALVPSMPLSPLNVAPPAPTICGVRTRVAEASPTVTARERERAAQAKREWLRTHPEEESQ